MSYTIVNGVVVPIRSIADLMAAIQEKADANK